jgi:16S rRNA (guanine(966)-N(2))-methyltransferase RsmD
MSTRPTTDRIKESLFNIIAAYIPGAYVLDLFAGTGNLGIESLSRGAEFAIFVDKSPVAAKIILENLTHTKLSQKAQIYTCDWFSFINKFDTTYKKFDIIFMDPPYSQEFIVPVLREIWKKRLLKEDGMIIVEREKTDVISEIIEGFRIVREKEYGRTVITMLRYNNYD